MLSDLLLSASAVMAVDQFSKALVVRSVGEGQVLPISVGFPVRIRRFTNKRVRPKCVGGRSSLIFLWGFAAFGAILLGLAAGSEGYAVHVSLGMAVGGATSNFGDRMWRGGIVDFVDLRCWPVFNLADLAIVIGVAFAFWFWCMPILR